ncbi:HAD family hydrolase [Paenibacillus hamazuiensis]|uniref:HAD family hydrolase n=1 Tax=Paenibacillus hamazuiensis TaxID=2936508 RepID=UPI00200BEADF|nr:HAD family hydrolase [Paenibacillus hamazuiensis]
MKPGFSPNQKKVLFFDVNQTLVMRTASFEDCFKETWKEYTARLAEGDDSEWNADHIYRKYRTAWFARSKMKRPGSDKQELQEKALREAVQDTGMAVSKTFARAFFSQVRQKQMGGRALYPGVNETLAALAPRYRLAIISNSRREEVAEVMRHLGLSAYFPEEIWFTASRPRDKKPNAHLFKEAMKALGAAAAECVMIGNSYRHDVCGAWKAGIDAIWVQRTAPKKVPAPARGRKKLTIVRQLDELLEWFT